MPTYFDDWIVQKKNPDCTGVPLPDVDVSVQWKGGATCFIFFDVPGFSMVLPLSEVDYLDLSRSDLFHMLDDFWSIYCGIRFNVSHSEEKAKNIVSILISKLECELGILIR